MGIFSEIAKLARKGFKKTAALEEVGIQIEQKVNNVQEVVQVHPIRSQSYYDDFAKSLDEGISCYNPRTGNTTLCKGNKLVVRQGNASLESTFTPWGSISGYAETSSPTYLAEVNFLDNGKALIRKRTVNRNGIYDSRYPYSSPFLNSHNSVSI